MAQSTSEKRKSLANRVRSLAEMARALRKGQDFPVTRLTLLKALCQDERDGAHFLVHLAGSARDQLVRRKRPHHVPPKEWARQQQLAKDAVTTLWRYIKSSSARDATRLRKLLFEIRHVQDTYEPGSWGYVRIITNPSLLIVEDALEGVLSPAEMQSWAYRAARHFAERYDSRAPWGLVPRSAPLVEEIADFWCRRLYGRSSSEWLASVRDERKQSKPRRSTQTRKAPPSAGVMAHYPSIAYWVWERGWITLGHTEGSGAFVQALDEGGMAWEGKATYLTLDAALADLEKGLAHWLASN
ncbi:hypothetical protein [Vitiosangium sp. GDMCC 1.1324]|uniref:hypothetical protein n=1 Tax=Vitiosangium sp. (strain GDMCC 1.1324) TaxID=2138576 RepID=UPI0018EE4AC9|nr:hypothetical protein [Vitiosangium sp. GDMCC 1.1324]